MVVSDDPFQAKLAVLLKFVTVLAAHEQPLSDEPNQPVSVVGVTLPVSEPSCSADTEDFKSVPLASIQKRH